MPNIQFVRTQNDTIALLSSYTDSIRYFSDTTFYKVSLRLRDADQNLYRCQILIDSGRIEAYYKGDIMVNPSLRVDQEFVDLSLIPKQIGLNHITFRLEDKFNEISEAKLNLFVFDNLLPIARFEAALSESDAREYTFNGATSFDQDHNFGGEVVAYEWNINGFIFTTAESVVKHVFERAGTYTIRLRVMDNNKAFSQVVEKRVTI
ncbi:PKD domain-containing protein [Sphingobacterium kitahiroshimense]|uniref:PKD domain-containing protein n=1 Tax=Sphingobacterium kitahiroshimense TaxID=470446 RepID=UPI003209735A